MPIVQVQLPDGRVVPVDTGGASPTTEDKFSNTLFAGAQKAGAGLLNLPVMAGRGINWALDKLGVPEKQGSLLEKFNAPNYLDEVGAKAEERAGPQIENPVGRSFVQGLAGAPLTPGSLASGPVRTLLSSGLPPAVGEAVSALGQDWAKTPAAILTGLATGGVLGGRGTRAEADIRQALGKESPAYFATAKANAEKFGAVGAKTATAAEAFPPNSAAMTLATRALNAAPGNSLRKATENRDADLADLTETFKQRVGSPVAGLDVANNAAGAATSVFRDAKALRGNEVRSALLGQTVTVPQAFGIISTLHNTANSLARKPEAAAYREVADALIGQGGPLTSVQDISFALKSLGKDISSPTSLLRSKGVSDVDLLKAIKLAENELEKVAPAYRPAMDQFKKTTERVILPLQQGPIGSLMDKTPPLAGQTNVNKLEALVGKGSSPQSVADTIAKLQATGEVQGPDIARALVDAKLHKGSTNPGAVIRGEPGSGAGDSFEALLKAGGVNPKPAMDTLDVADRMQKFSGSGNREIPKPSLGQALIRPFRTADMWLSGHTEHQTQQQLADLFAKGTPGAVEQLQQIVMFNPSVRKQLSLMSALNAYSQTKDGQ